MAQHGTTARAFGGIHIWMLALLPLLAAPVPHTFSNVGGLLTFDNFPIVPAGRQIIVELTVILDNSPTNAPGTQFVNTAKWGFDTFEVEAQ